MLLKKRDGEFPSVFVEDGETLLLSVKEADRTGLPLKRFRPRTAAAVLSIAGMPPRNSPRVSDRNAFEVLDRTEGFVNLADEDDEGRIGGYSPVFLKSVLSALDPASREIPARVQWIVASETTEHPCICTHRRTSNLKGVQSAIRSTERGNTIQGEARDFYVPQFIRDFNVFAVFVQLGDIVVGRNATLILDSDLRFAFANSLLCYSGSRIVQRANYLMLDVSERMRGGILQVVHKITSDLLTIDWSALAAQEPSKP